jgi:ABC-2 type transport system ATP-binding protein
LGTATGALTPAVEVERLGRTFRSGGEQIVALADVDLRVERGEIVGLLGENGAGKTTLTKIIATLLLPTSGMVRVFGDDATKNPREVRRQVGVVFGGDRGLYGRLTGRDNVRFFAVLAGVSRRGLNERVDVALQDVGLLEYAGRRVESYSKGMRQRLHIAIGMIAEPRLLLLDEPTIGLDPVEADRLRGSIARMRDDGVSVLLTSHYLLDIERLADRVVVLHKGAVAADLPVAKFTGLADYTATVVIRGSDRAPTEDDFTAAGIDVHSIDASLDSWSARLRVRRWDKNSFAELAQALEGVTISGVDVAPVRLDDVYANISERLRADAPR